jgi:hypothetical protein
MNFIKMWCDDAGDGLVKLKHVCQNCMIFATKTGVCKCVPLCHGKFVRQIAYR